MLETAKIVAFIMSADSVRSRGFYVDVLGLRFVSDDNFALVVESNGNLVRIGKAKEVNPARHTVLGWEVQDIETTLTDLQARGVKFQHYGFKDQDERGIWNTPDGSKVAWFLDPDGNVLSISQHG